MASYAMPKWRQCGTGLFQSAEGSAVSVPLHIFHTRNCLTLLTAHEREQSIQSFLVTCFLFAFDIRKKLIDRFEKLQVL